MKKASERDWYAPEYVTISQRARSLLSREEGFDVDFKRSLSGLEADDIVAFANSKGGGAILVGVDETRSADGRQVGVVVGCPVGDSEKRKILDKAHQCVPPVDLTVHVENRKEKPFYRIEIPPGANKPYCTSGGTYKSRGDGRKNTLYPTSLLALFLEAEGGEFLRRFQLATSGLEDTVQTLKKQVVKDLGDVALSISQMEFNVDESLSRIGGTAESAEENAMNANGLAEEVHHLLEQIHSLVEADDPNLYRISAKLDALLEKFDIEDPDIAGRKGYTKAVVGGVLLESKRRGLDTRPSAIRRRAKAVLAKPGAVWYPEVLNEALKDLAAAERAYLTTPPSERYMLDWVLSSHFADQKHAKATKPRNASHKRLPVSAPKK